MPAKMGSLGLVVALLVGAQPAQEKILPIQFFPHDESVWCWAACGQMVINYVTGKSITQCDQAKHRFARNDCKHEDCRVPGWPEFCKYDVSVRTTEDGETLDFGVIKQEIDAGRPVVLSWHNLDTSTEEEDGTGHMVVVSGYILKKEGNTVVPNLRILDPAKSSRGKDLPYDDFRKGDPSFRPWITFWNIHKIQK